MCFSVSFLLTHVENSKIKKKGSFFIYKFFLNQIIKLKAFMKSSFVIIFLQAGEI